VTGVVSRAAWTRRFAFTSTKKLGPPISNAVFPDPKSFPFHKHKHHPIPSVSQFPFRTPPSIVLLGPLSNSQLLSGATSTMSSSLKPSTIAAISVGTVVTGILAYAVYFDHRRRTDPDFRKALKRDSKKQARAAKEEAEAQGKEQKKAIQEAVARANEEGFPKDPEEVEAYFMQEVAQGEGMCQSGRLTSGRRGA
jgi:hypothetical protein